MTQTNIESESSERWQDKALAEKYVRDTDIDQKDYQAYYNSIAHDLFLHYCPSGTEVLDVGCGTGLLGTFLGQRGATVTGIDISAPMLEQFARQSQGKNTRLVRGSAVHLPFQDNSFDLVTAHRFLQHFPNWTSILKEMARCCRQEGIIMFNLFNRNHREWAKENKRNDFQSPFSSEEHCYRKNENIQFAIDVAPEQIHDLARSLKLSVVSIHPYCLLDKNQIIGYSLGTDKAREFDALFHEHLKKSAVREFLSWFEAAAGRLLPPSPATRLWLFCRKHPDFSSSSNRKDHCIN